MRRNLWLLDVTLLIAIIVSAYVLRQRWFESSKREVALLKQMVPVAPPPDIPGIPGATPATPANYMAVAQLNLFTPDRNSDIILDPPPPPPPPPEMPPLPVAYGVMDLGMGPTVILAEKAGAAHRGYRTGETIGAFKIVSLDNQEILFDWDGKPVKKTLEELRERKSSVAFEPPPPDAKAGRPSSQPTTTTVGGAKGPVDVDLGRRTKACAADDTSPAGTVQDGFRKVLTKSPFGEVCRWEPVE
jgi:hypothetical protein